MLPPRYTTLILLLLTTALSACGGSGGGSDDGESLDGANSGANSTVNEGFGDDSTVEDDVDKPTEPPTTPKPPTNGDEDADTDTDEDDTDAGSDPGTPVIPPTPPPATGTDDSGDSGSDSGSGSDQDQTDNEETDDSGQTPDGTDEDGSPADDNDNDSTPNDGANNGSDSLPGSASARFRVVNTGASNNQDVSVTTGQVFTRGAIPSNQTIAAFVDGQRIPTQVDKKATWQDGSLRHAVITVRVPEGKATASPTVELQGVDANSKEPVVSIGQLLATSFDATVSLDINGTEYKASARNLLSQADQLGTCSDWGAECKHWLSGPLTSEWIIGGPISSSGEAHRHLSVYFHVRAYANASGAVEHVRVDSVIENDWAYAPDPTNQRYNASITVGDNTFDAPDLTHYRQARWHKVMWWNGVPEVYAQLDTEYLQSTGAVSNYADLTMSDKFLNNRPSQFKPLTNGNQTPHMGNTGAQAAIGPLPRWSATYVVSGAQGPFKWMLANDDAVGSYGFHYRDYKTGRPLRITDHPYVTQAAIGYARTSGDSRYEADLLPACQSDCGSPYSFDISHHPSIGYVPYLVTGDYYYLEEMQFTASYIELWANPAYRNFDKGRLRRAQSQTRGQAWSVRSIADAAFATPDADPMKPYFKEQIATIVSDYLEHYVDADQPNPLHLIIGKGEWAAYPVHGEQRVGIAPWQADFFTWSVGHAAEQGFDNAPRLLKWLAEFQIGMMTNWLDESDTGYCWLVASDYKLQIRPSRDAPVYRTLNEAYKNTFPTLYGLDCNSQEYVNQLAAQDNTRYQRGQMSGYADSSTGFPANLQIGLAVAADSGLPNARKAWQIFDSRSVKPNYASYPNFAVEPRF